MYFWKGTKATIIGDILLRIIQWFMCVSNENGKFFLLQNVLNFHHGEDVFSLHRYFVLILGSSEALKNGYETFLY